MAIEDTHLSRRSLIRAAAPAIACGLITVGAKNAFASNTVSNAATGSDSRKIWSAEYWAKRGDTSLYLFRKRMGAPEAGQPQLPVLFLAHGSSVSSRPSFDLSVPGHGEYSLMDQFAGYGFDVWTMDFEGYGRSSQGAGNSDIPSGAEDLLGRDDDCFSGDWAGAVSPVRRVRRSIASWGVRNGDIQKWSASNFTVVHLDRRGITYSFEASRIHRVFPHAQPAPAGSEYDSKYLYAR